MIFFIFDEIICLPWGMSVLQGKSLSSYTFCVCGIKKSIKYMVDTWDVLVRVRYGLSPSHS